MIEGIPQRLDGVPSASPQSERPQGDRPQGDRPYGDRPPRAEGDRGPRGPREGGGDRGGDRGGPRGGFGGGGGRDGERGGRRPRRFHRGKVCQFTAEQVNYIDYKDIEKLRGYIGDNGKILPRRVTGASARHQRMITMALKRARMMALLPFKAR